jgi:nucleoid-associated protein YgaU
MPQGVKHHRIALWRHRRVGRITCDSNRIGAGMNRRRVTGLLALGALVGIVGGVALFVPRDPADPDTPVAFAPAVSADESVAPPDTVIEAPAALAALPRAPAPLAPDLATVGAIIAALGGSDRPTPSSPMPPPAGADAPPLVAPSFDIVRVEPTGEAIIAGLAEPGAKVEIMDRAQALATAVANDRGEFALALDAPLAPGTHDLALRTTAGTFATLSDERVAVAVPEKGSDDVLVILNAPDTPSRLLQVPEAPPQSASATVAALPRSAETVVPQTAAAVPGVAIAAVEADTAGRLFVAGTATGEGMLRIYLDGEAIGETSPTQAGSWLLETRRPLAVGTYRLRAEQIDKVSGAVIARVEVPFVREAEASTLHPPDGVAADGDAVIIKRGDNLWSVARSALGEGTRWSTIYEANRDRITNPGLIYPGQVLVVPPAAADR